MVTGQRSEPGEELRFSGWRGAEVTVPLSQTNLDAIEEMEGMQFPSLRFHVRAYPLVPSPARRKCRMSGVSRNYPQIPFAERCSGSYGPPRPKRHLLVSVKFVKPDLKPCLLPL